MFTSIIFFFPLACAVLGHLLFYGNFRKASEVPLKNIFRVVDGIALSLYDRELTSL